MGKSIDIMAALDGVLTEAATIRQAVGDHVSDAEMYHRINTEAGELLDCMGARWPDHEDRLKRVAAWAIASLVFGEEG